MILSEIKAAIYSALLERETLKLGENGWLKTDYSSMFSFAII